MNITHSSTAKQEEEQEERGSCQTLYKRKKILSLQQYGDTNI